jgi:hypothetical protein
MLTPLLKWAALATVWARIKPIFWGTAITAAFIFAVIWLQAQFVEFLRVDSEVSGASASFVSDASVWLGFSYLGKFVLICCGIAAWFLHVKRRGFFTAKKQARVATNAPIRSPVIHKKSLPTPVACPDKFDFLRGDRPLRSRGEFILDSKRPE